MTKGLNTDSKRWQGWTENNAVYNDEVSCTVPEREIEYVKNCKKNEKPVPVMVVLSDNEKRNEDFLAVIGHYRFKYWDPFFVNPKDRIKYLSYTQNAEKPMKRWKGKKPFYFFKGDACHLLLALIISDAFKVVFALTKHSEGDSDRSRGMMDYLLSRIGSAREELLQEQGKKLIESKGESFDSVKCEINRIVNEAIFGKEDPSSKEMHDRLKEYLLEDIPDPMDEKTDKDKVRNWGDWIYDSFDGFEPKDLLKFLLPPEDTEKQQDWENLIKVLQNH